MVDQKVKDELAKALKEARRTKEEKVLPWLPVVANTMLKGAVGERKRLYKKSGRPKNEERDKQWAREFLAQRKVKPARIKNCAIMAAIGKDRRGLSRNASIEAIKRGLEALAKETVREKI